MFPYQTNYHHKTKFLLNANRLTLIFWNQSYLSRWSCVISLIPLRLQQLEKLFSFILINLEILFLKIPKYSEFRRLESRLFYSIIFNGKKEFLLKLCLILKGGILVAFLVTYEDIFKGCSGLSPFSNFVKHS